MQSDAHRCTRWDAGQGEGRVIASRVEHPMGAVTKAVGSIFSGGEKAAKPPEPIMPPPAAIPPTLADASQSVAAQATKGKAAAGAMGGTVMTGPQGLTQKATTAKASLLSGAVGGDDA